MLKTGISVLLVSVLMTAGAVNAAAEGITMEGPAGKKSYQTIQAAFDDCVGKDFYTIRLQKGTYRENFINYTGDATVKIIGETSEKYGADVIIEGRGNNMGAMRNRELLEFQGNGNLILENLSLVSDLSRKDVKGDAQAEVLGYDGTGYVAAYNCSFKSHQDTMRTTGTGWFYKCYIEGDTDFIWMETSGVVALYEECEIVSVYDEYASTHASYVLAPRATVSTKVGKGAVIFNSTLKIQDGQETFLFRNPWGNNKNYYNNGAFVNVKVDGKLAGALQKSAAMGTKNQSFVGWKVDESFAAEYSGMEKTIGVISGEIAKREYAGRRAILNRGYSVIFEKFVQLPEVKFDVDKFIKVNKWKVSKDVSKDVLPGEKKVKYSNYSLTEPKLSGVNSAGFEYIPEEFCYTGKAGSELTVSVKGPCVVSVKGCKNGEGIIYADGQGEAYYSFATGSSLKYDTKDYIVYKPGKNTVTIKALEESSFAAISVVSESDIKFVPVSEIKISAADNVDFIRGNKTLQLSAVVLPENAVNADFDWVVSDSKIAEISKTGLLKVSDVETESVLTVKAVAKDESAFESSIQLKVVPTPKNAFDITWLDNTEANLAGVCSNEKIAGARNVILAMKDSDGITGTWKHNSSKLKGQGISLSAADNDPKKDDWYIDFPVYAEKALNIENVKINWGNCGTSNLRTYVTFRKTAESVENAVVIFDNIADKKLSSPRTSDNPSMEFAINQKLEAGETGYVRICVHGYRDGGVQTINGKSPTWGKTVISGMGL